MEIGQCVGVYDLGGAEDLEIRARTAAALTFESGVASETEDCQADGLVADPELLALIEPSLSTGVTLDSPDDAARYADFVMSCASPVDVTTEIVQSQAELYDQTTQNLIAEAASFC